MNKNFFIGILITASLSLTSICSFAEAPEAAPPIQLNQRTLFYEGTLPVTVNGRTLVPVNKFFNFAGIRANYYENENKIIIDSKDNKKRIALFIDDPIMQVYTYTTILQADRNDIVLDAAPILIDETPMCPLRAVLEELGYEVVWDEGAFSITVNTVTLPENTDELPSLTLYTEASDVNKGDIVELYVLLSRYESFKEEYTLSAVTSTVTYDKNEFEFISEEFVPDKPETIGINAVNQDFNGYAAKGVAVIMNALSFPSRHSLITVEPSLFLIG